MLRSLTRSVGTTFLAMTLIGAVALASDPGNEVAHRFKISIASNIEMEIEGKRQRIEADTEIHYNWTRSGRERVLNLESLLVRANMDGRQLMDTFMSREKFTNTEEGETNVVPIEKAPEELKKVLQDSFGVSICKIQVDENGREVQRTVLAGSGAKAFIDNGMIANAVLFHPPFPRDHDEWQADAEFSMGNGGYAKGKLAYKKITGAKTGQAVKVSGTLANESFRQPGTPLTIKKGSYVVRGEQTYDPAQQEWISGKLTIEVSYQMMADDGVPGAATGTMVLDFEKLPGNK